MKKEKDRLRGWLQRAAAFWAVLAAAGLGWLYRALPDTLYVQQGQTVQLAAFPYLAVQESSSDIRAAGTERLGSYHTVLALGGILPIKEVRTIVTARPYVTVCGTPFGIKMFSDGALVVGFSDILTPTGQANPAKEAGLRLGDRIVSIDGQPTQGNDAVAAALSAGRPVRVIYVREGEQCAVVLAPVQDETGAWRAGMWVRDSSAGVGTLTFVLPQEGVFAGLGHSISDGDTGETVALRSGEIVACAITGFEPGAVGSPGELKGQFIGLTAMGTIAVNGPSGVYGGTRVAFSGQSRPVAFAQEVEVGPAVLLTTIDGVQPQAYSVQIENVNLTNADHHDMVVRVTDKRLLRATGGIVQGMSGSPILQNGSLVGAVTHVLINDPTRGYGVFAQTMLEQAREVAQAQELARAG